MPPCRLFIWTWKAVTFRQRCKSGRPDSSQQPVVHMRAVPAKPYRGARGLPCNDITAQRARLDPASNLWDTRCTGSEGDKKGQRSLRHDDWSKLSLSLCIMPWRRIRNVQVQLLAWTLEPDQYKPSETLCPPPPPRSHAGKRYLRWRKLTVRPAGSLLTFNPL
jgi:hypothetical protein